MSFVLFIKIGVARIKKLLPASYRTNDYSIGMSLIPTAYGMASESSY